jgi:hypothetical protein
MAHEISFPFQKMVVDIIARGFPGKNSSVQLDFLPIFLQFYGFFKTLFFFYLFAVLIQYCDKPLFIRRFIYFVYTLTCRTEKFWTLNRENKKLFFIHWRLGWLGKYYIEMTG